jgi:thiol-disulfide isomerase/thioredoxin
MIKEYFQKKSKFGLAIDIAIVLLIIFLLIPATRKTTASFILKPTLFIHQAGLLKTPVDLTDATFDWQLVDVDGNAVNLADYKGKVIFINYWATWCAPCLSEMGQMKKLYKNYGDKVQFFYITNETKQAIREFIEKKSPGLPIYLPHTQYPAQLESSVLPTTFIIDKKGQLVMKKTGVAQWNSKKVKNILDGLINQPE